MKVNVFIWVVLSLFLYSCGSGDNQPVVVPKVEVHLSETVWEGTLTIGKAEEYPIKRPLHNKADFFVLRIQWKATP